ncbi:MAG: AMP-binding protein [Actinomycetes bacterium]
MDNFSQYESELPARELLHITPDWEIPQVLEALKAALQGTGPAITVGHTSRESVPAHCAVVIPTSGSTGQPKDVALSADALIASARAAHEYLGAKPGERWSLLLPITHIAGINVLVRALELGTAPVDMNTEAEFTAVVPTQLHRALHGEEKLLKHLQSAKAVLVGGAASSGPLLDQARKAGINPVTTYGMSEMSGGCIYNDVPLRGVRVRIKDTGAIELAGPMQAIGYLNAPELWNEVTEDEWFMTSDSGEIQGEKVFINGRLDDQINSGGKKISLSVIDNFLHDKFPRQRFASLAIPDKEWGEKLVLVVDGSLEPNLIKDSLREEFGGHAVPKQLLFNTEIPLISIGKPDRKKLREFFEKIV